MKGILLAGLGIAITLSSFIKIGNFQFPLNRFLIFIIGIFFVYLGIEYLIMFRR
ncbi:MAG: hypothetical protein JW728_04695 [Candidatus Aureabacteria bacterium]|nr:hypothetical protein [Candidatus Auribacterota bacterium]